MLESLGKSLSNIIDERLSNPLVVSFVLAWSGWNYKFIVLLLSKTPAMQTFDLIAGELYPTGWHYLCSGFLLPLATTLLYIYGLPFVSKYVNDHWRRNQLDDQRNRQRYEDKKLLSEEESRAFRAERVALRAENEKLTNERDQATEDAKEAFKAKSHAEAQTRANEEEARSAIDRYNNMKDSLESIREERDRNAIELQGAHGAQADAQALRALLDDVRHLIPQFGGITQGMRGIGEPQDGLILWYLNSKNVVEEPFTYAMLEALTIVESAGPMVRSGIVETAKNKLTGEFALRSLQTLFDRGYIAQAGRTGDENEPVYAITTRGKAVVEAAASYKRLISGRSPG
jgi:hypothetical protein